MYWLPYEDEEKNVLQLPQVKLDEECDRFFIV